MTPKMAWIGVAIFLAMMAIIIVSHRLFRPQAGESQTSKIEDIRRDDPLPAPAPEFSDFKKVHTITIMKPPLHEAPPALLPPEADAPSVTVATPAQPVEPPLQLPRHVQNDVQNDDDAPRHNSDGICAKYGGHKVTFTRHGWESWRCVYPHRH